MELHFSRCSKSIKGPRILPFIVAKHVIISIISDDSEIHRIKRVPLAVEFLHTKIPTANAEPQRAFIEMRTRQSKRGFETIRAFWTSEPNPTITFRHAQKTRCGQFRICLKFLPWRARLSSCPLFGLGPSHHPNFQHFGRVGDGISGREYIEHRETPHIRGIV
jgi:hypothetical protein